MENLKKIILGIKKAEKNKNTNLLELKKLIKYSNEIRRILGKYDSILFFIQPMGKNYINYEKEFNLFLKKIKTNSRYCPTFTYPEIEKIDIRDLANVISKLNILKKKIKNEHFCGDVHKIISEMLEISNAKLNFLKELKSKNFKKAFEFSKIIYGDIDEELCKKANKAYKEKIDFFKNRSEKSELENKLEKTNFDALEVKKYFEIALKEFGLKKNNYKILIDNKISSVKINNNDFKYCCLVISIPSEISINAIRLLQLIAHEIGKHVTTNYYYRKQGLTIEIGKNWNIYNEGLAKKNENEIKKIILGNSYLDPEIDFSIYYILAIEKIKKGWNFNKVYKYIHNKCYKENLYDCGYYNKNSLEKKKEIKQYCKKNSTDISKKICMRVFRGFNPKKGGIYFSKDKVYFEGILMVQRLEKIKSKDKLEKYLYLSKIDAKYTSALIKIGLYDYEKGLDKKRGIAKCLWAKKIIRDNILNNKNI